MRLLLTLPGCLLSPPPPLISLYSLFYITDPAIYALSYVLFQYHMNTIIPNWLLSILLLQIILTVSFLQFCSKQLLCSRFIVRSWFMLEMLAIGTACGHECCWTRMWAQIWACLCASTDHSYIKKIKHLCCCARWWNIASRYKNSISVLCTIDGSVILRWKNTKDIIEMMRTIWWLLNTQILCNIHPPY